MPLRQRTQVQEVPRALERLTVRRLRAQTLQAVRDNVERVIVGKREVIELALIGLICQGHLLIEDVPGVGKTMLANALARSIGCSFKRIQFTPDLLPSDVTGVSIYNQKAGDFEFRPGPIVAQVVLADEINRATPKTQASLLEAMEEHQITVDGRDPPAAKSVRRAGDPEPDRVRGHVPSAGIAARPLHAAVAAGLPRAATTSSRVLERQRLAHPMAEPQPVADADTVAWLQGVAREVLVDDGVRRYLVDLVRSSRDHPNLLLGASPRAALCALPSRSGARTPGRPRLRPSRRCEGAGGAGAGAPPDRQAVRSRP